MRVAEARARFGEILDEAEQGQEVVIERRGLRFRIVVDQPRTRKGARPALFASVDPDVLGGQWTWDPGPGGLAFSPRRKRR